jgi:hypothetical protein
MPKRKVIILKNALTECFMAFNIIKAKEQEKVHLKWGQP